MKSVFLYNSKLIQPALLKAIKDFILSTEPVPECDILVRWGNLKGDDNNAGIVLNRKQPLRRCLDTASTFEILRLNRVRRPRFVTPRPDTPYPLIGKFFNLVQGLKDEDVVTSYSEAQNSSADYFVECINTVKKYNIYVFDLNIFFVAKKVAVKTNTDNDTTPAWEYEEIPRDLDNDTQKACLLALRAVHVLGLDFAAVHAGIDAKGRPVILEVNPTPVLPPKALETFCQLTAKYVDRLKKPASDFHVVLGADPEFILRDSITGTMVYPSDYVNKEGKFGYDERSENREGLLYPLAEVRPEPDPCPLELTEKIKQILADTVSIFPPHIEWLAGSVHFERYQIGGHIHFSRVRLNSHLLRALDNYLGIPTMLLEEQVSGASRRKHYGMLGSIRVKPHGGFEYRTPASWLISPQITRACLCLAKIIATEFNSLNKDYFINPEMQKAFYLSKKHLFYDIFEEIWVDITKTRLYSLYAKHLAIIPDMIRSHSHWDDTADLRKTWGLLSSGH